MNKKGFAISVILYAIVFLIVTILYVILGIVKSRYNVNKDLHDNIVNVFNSSGYIHDNLTDN